MKNDLERYCTGIDGKKEKNNKITFTYDASYLLKESI